ncbi:MAG: hypothetical protein KJ583_02000 [Nanoarchaeota archaeon]|nr:hypothetical protein [Nanoarchaeota archaeon]MBU1269034.1 hypothetical protein [Nanoarchaeota archaeon]MBU1604066.1 hypothetical protein [Nanoarchaeota archaeon]MBU2442734.1 hypothetical protein [Nanoarchaeota archaeon]
MPLASFIRNKLQKLLLVFGNNKRRSEILLELRIIKSLKKRIIDEMNSLK